MNQNLKKIVTTMVIATTLKVTILNITQELQFFESSDSLRVTQLLDYGTLRDTA